MELYFTGTRFHISLKFKGIFLIVDSVMLTSKSHAYIALIGKILHACNIS